MCPRLLLLMLSVLSLFCIVSSRSTATRQDLSFVHTFDTRETCMNRCRTTCTQHHSEDLMMPRWQCPLQEDDATIFEEDEEDLFTNNLLVIVPCVVIGFFVFLFICISCVQRFCRSDV